MRFPLSNDEAAAAAAEAQREQEAIDEVLAAAKEKDVGDVTEADVK